MLKIEDHWFRERHGGKSTEERAVRGKEGCSGEGRGPWRSRTVKKKDYPGREITPKNKIERAGKGDRSDCLKIGLFPLRDKNSSKGEELQGSQDLCVKVLRAVEEFQKSNL